MTVDIEKLEMLAKAATRGPWVSGGTWVSTERGNSVADCARGDEKFIAAANPAVVLELIAENKSGNYRLHEVAVACATAEQERDAYRAVLVGAGYQQIPRIGALPPCEAKSIGSLAATMTLALQQERDQLKAEIAGLKTGYEAYERVNAELRAEN